MTSPLVPVAGAAVEVTTAVGAARAYALEGAVSVVGDIAVAPGTAQAFPITAVVGPTVPYPSESLYPSETLYPGA
ncbi:hypothetical protein [Nocardia brasiliensis]|uniref:hypothetical protein n=1 Tax=Nocardia brasiliensis TaxID=37326 RepID=UPI00366B849E